MEELFESEENMSQNDRRRCIICGGKIERKAPGGRPALYCRDKRCKWKGVRLNRSDEQREHHRKMDRERRLRSKAQRQQWAAYCSWCGQPFPLATAVSRCPGKECAAKRRSLVCSGVEGKRRAEAMGSEAEHFPLLEIANRDRYRCHVCGERVRVVGERGPDSLSIDHLVPITRGGAHTRENVALAHLGCNSARRPQKEGAPS